MRVRMSGVEDADDPGLRATTAGGKCPPRTELPSAALFDFSLAGKVALGSPGAIGHRRRHRRRVRQQGRDRHCWTGHPTRQSTRSRGAPRRGRRPRRYRRAVKPAAVTRSPGSSGRLNTGQQRRRRDPRPARKPSRSGLGPDHGGQPPRRFLMSETRAGSCSTRAEADHQLRLTAATVALHGHLADCAAKAGLVGMTKALALEWAGRGVTANTISPPSSSPS